MSRNPLLFYSLVIARDGDASNKAELRTWSALHWAKFTAHVHPICQAILSGLSEPTATLRTPDRSHSHTASGEWWHQAVER